MRTRTYGIATIAVLLTATGIAQAGSLTTPPISRSANLGQRVTCMITNTKSKAIGPFSITIYHQDGTVAITQNVATLAPKATQWLIALDTDLGTTLYPSCEVTGSGVSRKTPISLCVSDGANSACQGAVSAP